MKYTDISKQKKLSEKNSKNSKSKGVAKLFILFAVIISAGILFYFFRDRVKKEFSPVSIVGGTEKINIKQTDGRTNILILGSDKRDFGSESGRNSLTDTILVASIGNVDNDVVLISLPRDLWINNYTLENGYNYSSKINEVYANAGIEELKKQMEVVLGIPIHYYVMVTFDLFENIIDTLGGIEVNVENSFTDYAYPVEGKENDTCGRTQEEADNLAQARRVALAALARRKPTTILEDATVPRSKVPEMLAFIDETRKKFNLDIGTFGHAGDGNLHPTCLTDERNTEEMHRVEEAFEEIFKKAISLGGTVTGEHGVGCMKSKYLPLLVGETGIKVMKRMKQVFDPEGILNPGKIFVDKV